MTKPQRSLRNIMLTGAFAVVPVGVTIFIVWKIETLTRGITDYVFGRSIPVVGIFIAVAVIYLAGVLISSIVGQWFIRRFRSGAQQSAWPEHALSNMEANRPHAGRHGGNVQQSGADPVRDRRHATGLHQRPAIDGHDKTWCVFVPSAPNPLTGRMHFIPQHLCVVLDCSAEEAFKVLLSTGNYVPAVVGAAISAAEAGASSAPQVIE